MPSSSDLSHVHTVSRKAIYIKDPDPRHIDIEDIAHALSLHCRYGGQIPRHYSVAQHSVLVSQLCDPKDAFWGLMHDAAEAYTGDIISPIKVLLRDYKKVEAYFMNVICDKFGLSRKMPASVKVADYNAYLLEEHYLRGNNQFPGQIIAPWVLSAPKVRFWTPEAAEKAFLRRFKELTK